jgi:hypothetical protein
MKKSKLNKKSIMQKFPKLTDKQEKESDRHTKNVEKAALHGLKHLD